MTKEEFIAKISEFGIAPNDNTTAVWIKHAEGAAEYYSDCIEDCGSPRNEYEESMAKRLTLESNLDDLYAAFLCVHQKFGSEATQRIYLLGEKNFSMDPNSFMQAAEFLLTGDQIHKLKERYYGREFENGRPYWECSINDCDVSLETATASVKNPYFTELSRILLKSGIQTARQSPNKLTILQNGQPICHALDTGTVFIGPGDAKTAEAEETYHTVAVVAENVCEYMTAMSSASPLKATDLDEKFSLLAEFNDVVLAGRKTESGFGMKFVTWERDYNKSGVVFGHYYHDDYVAAKQDFAVRAGLIQQDRIFNNDQLFEIYQCINATFAAGYDLTYEELGNLKAVQNQIEAVVPDLDLRIQKDMQKAIDTLQGQSM